MRVGSFRLVLRVSFLALAASLLLAAAAPAAGLPGYRCCFRIDALMTGRLDTGAGGPTSHLLVPPTRAQFATLRTKKLSRVRRFGKDAVHNPILSTLIPHKTTGFVPVDVCIRFITPQRVRSEATKIRALVGKEPTRVTSLRCR